MSYQALYRKYRPATFSDVTGQEHITETLKNELAAGKVFHAYLFTGTRGTGKTSCAKILAKAVNCLKLNSGDPCLECEICRASSDGEVTDIVEIDAASNNGVENIRELREQVNFAPAMTKYRVYIIDEVHMLSIGAFNALLKTLEEPPPHVVFILATTEVHKLPATILSRCQRFDFRRIELSKICERIQYISDKEGLTVTQEAACLIASAADGGMRDALSILDLCASSSKKIDEQTVEKVCAMAGNDYLIKLGDFIKDKDPENALLLIDKLHNASVDMQRLLGELISHYRNLMIIKTVKTDSKPIICSTAQMNLLNKQADNYDIKDIMRVISLLQNASGAMQSGNRRCEIEMTLIKLCNPELCVDLESLEKRISALENGNVKIKASVTPASAATSDVKPNEIYNNTNDTEDEEIPLSDSPADDSYSESDTGEKDSGNIEMTKPAGNNVSDMGDDLEVSDWNGIIKLLRSSCPIIAGVLNGSKAYIRGEYLLIDAPNSQFRTLVKGENPIYRDSIRKTAAQVLGKTYKLGPYTGESNETKDDPLAGFAAKLKNLEIK